MENPYKRLRLLTSTSQKDFAEKYGFAKTAMTFIESGQYPSLSSTMLKAIGMECQEKGVEMEDELVSTYGTPDLQTAYHGWQSSERMQVAHLFQTPPSGQSTPDTSPFAQFVIDTTGSAQKFCKTLKVPAATVMRYSTGATLSMPAIIRQALLEVRFQYIGELEAAQERWNAGLL